MRLRILFPLFLIGLCFSAGPASAGIGLGDAVNALQAAAGIVAPITVKDVDGDQRIGLPEAIHALQVIAGLRDPAAADPLYPFQWHIRNTGQKTFSPRAGTPGEDMHMVQAMAAGLDGTGIIVAVVDSGMEIAHEDLSGNVIPGGSWNFANATADPSPAATETKGDHGTSVTGIIAAVAQNGKGGRGIAPKARLKGFNAQLTNQTSDYIASLGGDPNRSQDVHVFNMSYGGDDNKYVPMLQTYQGLYASSGNLRGGKGAIYVKSAGNGYGDFELDNKTRYSCVTDTAVSYPAELKNLDVTCQNAAGDEENARPELIVVGAYNASGVKASYSTAGSTLWVSAPGGEYGSDAPAILTVDQSGCDKGYSRSRNLYTGDDSPANDFETGEAANNGRYNPGCNYTSGFNGTSSAAPNTSGAVALLLHANPNLTRRDVKHILAKTARQIDAAIAEKTVSINGKTYVAEQAWITNKALPTAYKFHNWYGFGAVDVDAAVAMAKNNYTSPLGTIQGKTYGGALAAPLPIPDATADGATTTLSVSDNLTIENLSVTVATDHPQTGEIAIELTSPSGTKSILLNLRSSVKSGLGGGAVFGSNAFYGEKSQGTWTLKVVDGVSGNTGSLKHFALAILGY